MGPCISEEYAWQLYYDSFEGNCERQAQIRVEWQREQRLKKIEQAMTQRQDECPMTSLPKSVEHAMSVSHVTVKIDDESLWTRGRDFDRNTSVSTAGNTLKTLQHIVYALQEALDQAKRQQEQLIG